MSATDVRTPRAMRVKRSDGAALFALGIPFVLLARHFWWVCDDAFISFRYASNWAAGHGLRYNLGEHSPVEGFSNFLWIVPTALIELLGADPTLWMPAISILCGVALLALVYRFLVLRLQVERSVSFLATLTLALFPPFAVWATSGLETMAFALTVFLLFDLWIANENVRPVASVVAGLALCLLRTEGIAWVLVLAGLALVFRAGRRRAIAQQLAIVLVIFSAYFVLRYEYYGLPFPHPVYTKVKFSPVVALRGFRYVATFFLTFLTPFLVLPAIYVTIRSRGTRLLPGVLMALAFPAYAIVVGGDYLAMGRFLVPGLAFGTILLGLLLEWLAGHSMATSRSRAFVAGTVALTLVTGALPGWDVHLVPESIRYKFWFRYHTSASPRSEASLWSANNISMLRRRDEALALKRISLPGDSLVFGGIGSMGYYSDLFIYDQYGLVTREVALRPQNDDEPLSTPGHDLRVESNFFIKQRPTYISLASFVGGDIGGKVLAQAELWRTLLQPSLWRSYVPDVVEIDARPDPDAHRVVMVLRLIEEAPGDPTARATAMWEVFFARARLLSVPLWRRAIPDDVLPENSDNYKAGVS